MDGNIQKLFFDEHALISNATKLFYSSTNFMNHLYLNFSASRYADQVSNGNEVLVQRNDYLIPTTVINVSTSKMQGRHHSHCADFYILI